MTLANRIRRLTANPDASAARSIAGRARSRRWHLLLMHFPDLADMEVLDLGGRLADWSGAPVRPRHVTSLNMAGYEQRGPAPEWFERVAGDACDPPPEVSGRRFDLVYSNSVIEHVGGPANERRFADVATGLADHCWVQTPYRYFPIEPHWLFPGFQFLPTVLKVEIGLRWPISNIRPRQRSEAVAEALGIRLLSRSEMKHYFPQCSVISERFFGLTKSLIAVR